MAAPVFVNAYFDGTYDPSLGSVYRTGDVLSNLLDDFTGQYVTFKKVTKYIDGSPMDGEMVDHIIYRQLDNEYFADVEFLSTQSFDIKRIGAKCDGVSDDGIVFQKAFDKVMPNGSTLHITGDMVVSGNIVCNKSIHIDGHYHKITRTDRNAFYFFGEYELKRDVTNITIFYKNETPEIKDENKVRVNVDPTDFAVGDVVKIVADENYHPRRYPMKIGQFETITSIGADYLALKSLLVEKYTTGIRIAKLKHTTLTINNLTFSKKGLKDTQLFLLNLFTPTLNQVTFDGGRSSAVRIYSCYYYKFNDCNFYNLENLAVSPYYYGYGIEDVSGYGGTINNPKFDNVRHLYTTNNSTPISIVDPESASIVFDDFTFFGEAMFTAINNGTGTALNAAYDTHEEGYGITFNNCISLGSNELSGGFHIRSRNAILNNCVAYGAVGFLINCFTAQGDRPDIPAANDILLNNCYAQSNDNAIRLVGCQSETMKNIRINGGYFSSSLQAALVATNAEITVSAGAQFISGAVPEAIRLNNVHLNFYDSEVKNNKTDVEICAFLLTNNSKLYGRNSNLLTASDSNTFRLVKLNQNTPSSPGQNEVRIENCYVSGNVFANTWVSQQVHATVYEASFIHLTLNRNSCSLAVLNIGGTVALNPIHILDKQILFLIQAQEITAISNGRYSGQQIVIENNNPASANDNLILPSSLGIPDNELTRGSILTLMWSSNKWIEISRILR